MSFLKLNNICKNFGQVKAVDNVNLEVNRGEFVSLLGPSGCGKTTTLQMIAGFEEPTSGNIELGGHDMTSVEPKERDIGIVFQSYALFPHMTVAENVGFGLEMRKIGKAERKDRVAEVLDLVHLGAFADRVPKALSGGQRQRVALARAIVIRPQLLLLDEPLSALDAKIREDMQVELRNIQSTVGVTTILVTHDQGEAMALSDRVAVMKEGRLVQFGAPFETYEHPGDRFTSSFLGKTNLLEAVVVAKNGDFLELDCSGVSLSVSGEAAIGQEVTVSLRPEKISVVEAGNGYLDATISSRVFLGNCWAYQLDSTVGSLQVTLQNSGEQCALPGDRVGLRWKPETLRLLNGA